MTSPLSNPARLAALADTELVDRPSSALLDRYVRIATAALGVPVALVSLVDAHRQFFSSLVGLTGEVAAARGTPLTHSFCQHVVTSDAPLIVNDARLDSRVAENLAVRDLSVIAYAGMPIRTDDAFTLGSFCAVDTRPKAWSERDLAVLRELAAAVGEEIDLRRRALRAERSEATLGAAIERLEAVHDLKAEAARQTTHDLRTPLQVLGMGVASLRAHAGLNAYPELVRMTGMLERNLAHATALVSDMHSSGIPVAPPVAAVDLTSLIEAACADHQHRLSSPIIRVDTEAAGPTLVSANASELRRCLDNLLTNAQRFARSKIQMSVRSDGHVVEVYVHDDGSGLPSAAAYGQAWRSNTRFHEADGRSGTGLGLAIVRSIVEQAGGTVRSGPSHLGGAVFGFELPVLAP